MSPEDIAKCDERYNKSKMVHSIMRHVAETTGADLEALYTQIAWPMYRLYGHAFDAFKQMVMDDGEAIFARLESDRGGPVPTLVPGVRDGLLKNIKRRMTPQPLKIRADVELTCFQYDGVEHLKAAIRARRGGGCCVAALACSGVCGRAQREGQAAGGGRRARVVALRPCSPCWPAASQRSLHRVSGYACAPPPDALPPFPQKIKTRTPNDGRPRRRSPRRTAPSRSSWWRRRCTW